MLEIWNKIIVIDDGYLTIEACTGLPRSAKYGIIVGVGIPGLVCIIGLVCYACGMVRAFNIQRRLNSGLPTVVSDQRPTIRSASGLDRPTIESYPTTVLGESRRLPEPNDGTCPICLSEYQPKETLRSLPECNHYFHANCIDEWLKLNGTCPLCRNSPDSSVATPSSSMSISSSTSSSTTLDRH
ncbi:UNVERIFIED_CONTAM: putative RING-H2 finger protein ATL69 [Sesamum angustifolium]|uniref:RING-type E3 ubiquitin transferase n=1 Tax=Sesamum angustifolium TaxID=2727405 RepID=A0AAW2MHU5_9LAMI